MDSQDARRPRLCMVVHAYYPLGEPRVQREARAARSAGFDVSVLCLRAVGEARVEVVDGIAISRAPLRHQRGATMLAIFFEYLAFCLYAVAWVAWNSFRRPFDIVHVHNPPDFLIVCGVVPKLRGSRVILDVHDISAHMFAARVDGLPARWVSRALVLIERWAARLADGIITVHQPYRLELITHGISASKIRIVMNSVDEMVLRRAREEHVCLPALQARFTVAYHGTVTSWYGTDLIVAAIDMLTAEGLEVGAVILGDGDAVPELRTQAARRGLESRIFIAGRYLPIEQALAIVRNTDCGVIPNRPSEINRFALSSKLFEYIALGIPVVVAQLPTLAAHFSSDEVTFFEAGNASSLAAALRWVQGHPEEACGKAIRASARAAEYSWGAAARVLISLYEELMGLDPRL